MKFGERSYISGSANRVAALLANQAQATIIDLSNKNKIMASSWRSV
jgi:NitT/TauT family transport system substrate-binding protein